MKTYHARNYSSTISAALMVHYIVAVHFFIRNFEREEALTDFVMHDRDQDWRVSWKEYLHLELGYQAELVDNGTISMEQFNKTYMV